MTCTHSGAVRRLVDDLANLTEPNTLRALVVMAAVQGGADVLRVIGDEARREAMVRNLRAQLDSAQRRGDETEAARCKAALERLEAKP